MARFAGALWLVLLATGCGGYASTSEAFRTSLDRGDPNAALSLVNKALKVDRAEQLPPAPGEDTPLLLLERATILQALQRYDLSARDLQAADKNLDVLDLTNDTAGQIGKYLFSDDATIYKAPPHEKLLLSTVNMINYLALGDVSGAKVEARRLVINRKYLQDADPDARAMLALGSYLAGYAFEQAGEPGTAMRHYADAHEAGGVPGLREAVLRLHARTDEGDPRLGELLSGHAAPCGDDEGDLLTIVQTGMAPFLVPERLPIGAAVVVATAPGPGARLSPADRRRANTFAAKGLLKWVNYPSLRRVRGASAQVQVAVGGRSLPAGVALNVERRVVEQYERNKGTLVAASITRLLTRAVAGELTNVATRKASDSGPLGLLLGLAVEGALTAADTPDTRSWVTLPARFHVARACVPAGRHAVSMRYRGRQLSQQVEIRPGGWAVANFSALR